MPQFSREKGKLRHYQSGALLAISPFQNRNKERMREYSDPKTCLNALNGAFAARF